MFWSVSGLFSRYSGRGGARLAGVAGFAAVLMLVSFCQLHAAQSEGGETGPAAARAGESADVEDINSSYDIEWRTGEGRPEDIKPAETKRNAAPTKKTGKKGSGADAKEKSGAEAATSTVKPPAAVEGKPARAKTSTLEIPSEPTATATSSEPTAAATVEISAEGGTDTGGGRENQAVTGESRPGAGDKAGEKEPESGTAEPAEGEKSGSDKKPPEVREKKNKPPPAPFPPSSKRTRAGRGAPAKNKVRVSGNVELRYQSANGSGNETGFLSQNGLLYYRDALQQRTRLSVKGEFENGLSLDGAFTEVPYQDRLFNLNLTGGRGHARLGDTPAEFRAGPMASFKKNIRGLDLMYKFGGFTFSAIVSRQKSSTGRETFNGRNIRGPYVLRSNSILEDSETVYINGRQVSRNEYSIDCFFGQITFNRNLDPTDVVEITYESVLLVSMRTGALNGFSLQSDPGNKRYDAGVAWLRQGTGVRQREVVHETTKIFSGSEIASGGTYGLGEIKLQKNTEMASWITDTASNVLSRGADYSMDYPAGRITFLRDFPATDTVRVSFSYYDPEFLQWISGEELRGSNRDSYVLQMERIYGGTEVADLYVNGILDRRLEPDRDYVVNEANNSIDFLDQNVRPEESENRYVEISYEIVPSSAPGATETELSMLDLTGRLTLGSAVFRSEYAETESDITMKLIQVSEERVATVSDPARRDYPLDFKAIPNTEEIFFNDTVSANSRQTPGSDYGLEYDGGTQRMVVRFKKDIPVGTTILANYKYAPELPFDSERKGRAGRITADVGFRNGTISGEFMRKSWFFAPPTGYNDLEAERASFRLNMTPARRLSLSAGFLSQKHGADFSSHVAYTTMEWNGRLEYGFGIGRRAGYSFTRRTRTDSLAVRGTDQNQTTHRIEGGYAFDPEQKTALDFHLETRDFSDATLNTSDYNVFKGGVGVSYAPAPELKLSLSTNSNRVGSTAPPAIGAAGDFVTKTLSNVLDATYTPDKIWTLAVRSDTQAIRDSRPEVGGSRVDTIDASAQAKPGTRVNTFLFSYNRQSRPNPYYGDSLTDATTMRLEYRLAGNWTLTPRFAYSKATVVDRSRGISRNAGLLVQYRAGALKGWNGSVQFNRNRRTGENKSAGAALWTPSSNTQDKITLTTGCIPSGRLEWKNTLSLTSNGYETGSNKQTSLSTGLNYVYSPSTKLHFSFNTDKSSAGTPTRKRYEIESETLLDKNNSLSASLARDNQGGSTSQAYSGTIFNMRLNMDF